MTATCANSENTATSINFDNNPNITPHPNTSSDNGTTASLVVNNDSASQEPNQDTASITPPMSNVPASTMNESDDGTAVSHIVNVNNDSASQESQQDKISTTPPISTVPASTRNDSCMDVNTSASATEINANPVPRECDQEETTNVVAVAAPGWLNVVNMDIYLQDCSDVKEWKALVQSLYKFEEGNTINGVRHYNCTNVFLTNYLLVKFTNYQTPR